MRTPIHLILNVPVFLIFFPPECHFCHSWCTNSGMAYIFTRPSNATLQIAADNTNFLLLLGFGPFRTRVGYAHSSTVYLYSYFMPQCLFSLQNTIRQGGGGADRILFSFLDFPYLFYSSTALVPSTYLFYSSTALVPSTYLHIL